jgi:4-hydroxybenzoate polyprenyltransferase
MSDAKSQSYLQLIRFPLIFTAWSDVLTGYFILTAQASSTFDSARVAVMLAITVGLFGGGMTLLDCFGYESDKEHGRQRTLPVGVVSLHGAFAVAFVLILVSIAGASFVSSTASLVSALVALLLLVFAALTRGLPILSSVNLSLIRGLNVILGMAFAYPVRPSVNNPEIWGPVAAVLGYVFLVTRVASEEGHPRRERLLRLTGGLVVLLVVLNVFLYVSPLSRASIGLCIATSVFVAGTIARLLQLARRAVHELSAESVQKLVVAGLVGSIVLNANFVAFTDDDAATLGVLFLLLPTFLMFRFFHAIYQGTRTAID